MMPSFSSPTWITTLLTVVVSSLVTLALLLPFSLGSPKSKASHSRKIIPSPRDTQLPFLSRGQASALPYPPDILPGARDVDSPYGVMRVYEWGPEEGRKVVMVHGDTTPAPLLGPIAKALVERGCRVLLLDLWGRGYSDTPLDVPHDVRLFTMQIFFAIASSRLPWTGATSGGFSIIGFSLGGGISMSFAAHFPYLLNSIILLAPGGILRAMPNEYESIFFRYPSIVPSRYLRKLVGKVLGVDLAGVPHSGTELKRTILSQADAKVPGKSKSMETRALNAPDAVQWQFDNHQGFIHSFISTIQLGPITHQQSDWNKICNIIKGESMGMPGSSLSCKIYNSKILVVFGDSDGVVVGKDVSEDLVQMLGGPEHVEFKTVPGGHGFPLPSSDEVVKHISDFWKLEVVD